MEAHSARRQNHPQRILTQKFINTLNSYRPTYCSIEVIEPGVKRVAFLIHDPLWLEEAT